MKKTHISRGFTLIELLVVIAIIAVMTGVILVALQGARGKSRDGKRISDISQIQLALEQYFDRCGQYPPVTFMTSNPNTVTSSTCPSGITLATFISTIPTVPSIVGSQTIYYYAVNTVNGVNSDYVVGTALENTNEAVADGMSGLYGNGVPSSTWTSDVTGFVCDNTVNSTHYCVGPK